MPIQNGQDGQQIAYLFHAVQTMLDIVLPQESLDIIHVRGGVHILIPPLLAGLRPLSSDEQDGGDMTAQDSLADSLPPVGLNGPLAVLSGHIGGDLPADVQGVLLSAVLLGEDHQIGVFARNLPQVLPPVQGLFPRTAKDSDDPPAGIFRLDRAEQRFEAHSVVGIVYDGGDRFISIRVNLHPAGDPGLHQPHIDTPLRDVQRLAHGDGGQRVLHVEQAGHGQPKFPQIAPGADPEQNVVPPLADLGGVDIRLLILLRKGEQGPACRPGRL